MTSLGEAPLVKSDQATKEAYVPKSLKDKNFRLVKMATIKAQRANIAEDKVRIKLQGIHASLYVAMHPFLQGLDPHLPGTTQLSQSDS
jgi:hypothetical protein